MKFYYLLQERLKRLVEQFIMEDEEIMINTSELTPEEAIGHTERSDYPINHGQEVMVEARYRDSVGQTFTDEPTDFIGTVDDILNMDLTSDRNKSLFIACMNSILNHLQLATETVHCKNERPEQCAVKMKEYMLENHKGKRIGLVGYQPAILAELSKEFNIRITDLNPDNIGRKRSDILVEDGQYKTEDLKKWADILLVTGSTINNGSIVDFLNLDKKVYFFGTSISGAAHLMGLNKLCFYGD